MCRQILAGGDSGVDVKRYLRQNCDQKGQAKLSESSDGRVQFSYDSGSKASGVHGRNLVHDMSFFRFLCGIRRSELSSTSRVGGREFTT